MPTWTPIPPGTDPWGTLLDATLTTFSDAIDAKAEDSATVHLSGAETITGAKTFSAAPAVPDASFAISKVNGLQSALDAKSTNYARTTTQVVTGGIAAGGQASFTIPVGNVYVLSKIQVDKAARIRVYATIAQRTADASRGAVLPTGDHGVEFEYTSAGAETMTIAPSLTCDNFESTINAPILIDNPAGTMQSITVTFTFKRME